jgi:hypothetical protein
MKSGEGICIREVAFGIFIHNNTNTRQEGDLCSLVCLYGTAGCRLCNTFHNEQVVLFLGLVSSFCRNPLDQSGIWPKGLPPLFQLLALGANCVENKVSPFSKFVPTAQLHQPTSSATPSSTRRPHTNPNSRKTSLPCPSRSHIVHPYSLPKSVSPHQSAPASPPPISQANSCPTLRPTNPELAH